MDTKWLKRVIPKILIVLIMLTAFVLPAIPAQAATTIYVSGAASNGYQIGVDNLDVGRGLSKALPYLTVPYAFGKASSGDTIVINDGSYAIDGASFSARSIILTPENALAVTFTTTNPAYIMYIKQASSGFITINDIVFDGAEGTSSALYLDNIATIYTVTLNRCQFVNLKNMAINGFAPTKINFTMTDCVITNAHVLSTYFAVDFESIIEGYVNIHGGTITVTPDAAGASASAIQVLGGAAATATVTISDVVMTHVAKTNTNTSSINIRDISNVSVTGCTQTITESGVTGRMSGIVVFALNSNISNISVTDNEISITESHASGFDGIRVYSLTNGHTITGVDVSDNIVHMLGTATVVHCIIVGEDNSDPTSAGYHTVTNMTVKNNTVNGSAANWTNSHGIEIGNQVGGEIAYNMVSDLGYGIVAKGDTGTSVHTNIIVQGRNTALYSKACTGAAFYNNTIILTGASNYGIEVGPDAVTGINSTGALIKNNLVYSVVTPATGIITLDDVNQTATISNNLYACTTTYKFNYKGTSYATVANWITASGETGVINEDPQFIDYAGGNYRLQYTSPAINKGASVGLTTDYLGNPIVLAPDIGAYEYQAEIYSASSFVGYIQLLYAVPALMLPAVLILILGMFGLLGASEIKIGDTKSGVILWAIGLVFIGIVFITINFVIEAINNAI